MMGSILAADMEFGKGTWCSGEFCAAQDDQGIDGWPSPGRSFVTDSVFQILLRFLVAGSSRKVSRKWTLASSVRPCFAKAAPNSNKRAVWLQAGYGFKFCLGILNFH